MKLVQYPDPILTTPTEQVEDFAEAQAIALSLRVAIRLNDDLVGLAANQIGIGKSVCIVALTDQWLTMVNPKIIYTSPETAEDVEGCGSLREPEPIYVRVSRPVEVEIKFQDLDGQRMGIKLRDFEARVAQHEIDHLDGILIIERGQVVIEDLFPVHNGPRKDDLITDAE